MIDWIGRKVCAVVRLLGDLPRLYRDRYSTFYPHGILRRVYRRFPTFAGIEVFVETGTFRGKTACQESRYFRDVHTIELNEELFLANGAIFENYPNVHAYQGDCVETLPKILSELSEPCVFFLDAHWSGDQSVDWGASEWKGYGVQTSCRGEKWPPDSDQQCPLVDEASLINAYPYPCILIVDDWDAAGKKNTKFKGEDWSSITLERILGAFDESRVVSYFTVGHKGKMRLIILLCDPAS